MKLFRQVHRLVMGRLGFQLMNFRVTQPWIHGAPLARRHLTLLDQVKLLMNPSLDRRPTKAYSRYHLWEVRHPRIQIPAALTWSTREGTFRSDIPPQLAPSPRKPSSVAPNYLTERI